MRINWLMIAPLVLTVGFFGVAAYQLSNNQNALQPLADTELLSRADLEGNGLVVVNFWASWCPPCRAEHPTLTAMAEAGVPLYGVNYRDRIDQALSFLDELGNPYDRIGRDDQARNGADWGVVAMPETFFIDDTGTVVLHFRGPVTERALRSQIRPALAAAGHELPLLPGEEAAVN